MLLFILDRGDVTEAAKQPVVVAPRSTESTPSTVPHAVSFQNDHRESWYDRLNGNLP